jgi:FixJ family two-component response regulator
VLCDGAWTGRLSLDPILGYISAKSTRGCAIAYEAKIAGGTTASREAARQRVAQLVSNERRALQRIVDGYSLVKIAGDLGIELEEALRLKASLFRKLGAMTTADLVRVGLYAQDA